MPRTTLAFILGFLAVTASFAQEAATPSSSPPPTLPELKFRTGEILLPNKVAMLRLTDNYR